MKYYIILIAVVVASCSNPRQKILKSIALQDTIKYQKPQTLSITGDFDGDGKQDTITQFLANRATKPVTAIPVQNTWEESVAYFSQKGYYTAIVMNHSATDTLKFENSQGLYCLINVGDLNNDKRDEIALVQDSMDFSRHNYCHIYSACITGWADLFTFNIHEDAFDYDVDRQPLFKNIPGALEYRNDKWLYLDYLEMEYESAEEVGQMKPLLIGNCQK